MTFTRSYVLNGSRISRKNKNRVKTILELNYVEANDFFKKSSSYCNFELPPYFDFNNLIGDVSEYLEIRNIEGCYKTIGKTGVQKEVTLKPHNFEGVNYKLLNNKDGKYAWRPFQLINPALYVATVNKMTEESNWQLILDRFRTFKEESYVECISIPLSSEGNKSDKEEMILQWWMGLEQKSIELALDYDYTLHTDITDCYGSIYTHSISWALHDKETAKKERKRNKLLGNYIDGILSDMSYGQTNGIPQGSVLMDFIAEMVLGYSDLLLTNKIKSETISDYKILRYRDDYRIFSNNPQVAEKIVKCLTEVLSDLGLRINNNKTLISDNVILSSIKQDKAYWISYKNVPNGFQKRMYSIFNLAEKYPNSATLVVELNDYLKTLEKTTFFKENPLVITSILIDITTKNPKVNPVASAILSRLITYIDKPEDKSALIQRIIRKYSRVPNTGLLELWLQRIFIQSRPEVEYNEPLCKLVKEEGHVIWNLDWMNDSLRKIISGSPLINKETIGNMSEVISSNEVGLFASIES